MDTERKLTHKPISRKSLLFRSFSLSPAFTKRIIETRYNEFYGLYGLFTVLSNNVRHKHVEYLNIECLTFIYLYANDNSETKNVQKLLNGSDK